MSTVCVGHNLEIQGFVYLLLSMGCILKMDSFYNSTLFGITSNQQGSSVARTVRKGKCAAVDSEGIIVPKWNDMKDVPGIITYHDIKLVPHKT